ncbi:MAG TPA: acyltransferase [Terracidiphilus sp.]|nr:acyltransferase [Terracidiphilus sp.]
MPQPNATQASALARNAGIDFLRGLSIVLVLLNHIGLRLRLTEGVLGAHLPREFLNDLTFNGSEAVYIFFVISGFLITSNALARWGSPGAINLRGFYVRRAARILPCLVMLVGVLSALHLLGVHDFVIHRQGQSLHGAAGSAFGLYLNWYEAHTGYLPANWDVLWSLSIEEVFYLGFPLMCILLRRTWLLAPAMALLALSLPFSLAAIVGNPIWKEKAYLPGMAAIAMGVLGALVAKNLRPKGPKAIWPFYAVGVCGLVGVLGFEDQLSILFRNGTILLLTFSALCMVLAFHWSAVLGSPARLIGFGWLCAYGRLSYEIYLTHMFVVIAMLNIFSAAGASMRWGILWYAPTIAACWVLGWAVAKFLSVPCDKAMRRRLLASKPAAKERVAM